MVSKAFTADQEAVRAFMTQLGATHAVRFEDLSEPDPEHRISRIAYHSPCYIELTQPIATWWSAESAREHLSYENWASDFNERLHSAGDTSQQQTTKGYNVFTILERVSKIVTGMGEPIEATANIVTLYAECTRYWQLDTHVEDLKELTRANEILHLGLTPSEELELARNDVDIPEIQALLNSGQSYMLVRELFKPYLLNVDKSNNR